MIPQQLRQKLKSVQYFSKGKRSLVYTAIYKNKKVAVKIKHPKSTAKGRIQHEAKILKRINKDKIGPNILEASKNYILYEFIDGPFFVDWVKSQKEKEVKKAIKKILTKCRRLDKLNINKKEFNHPIKHIIMSREKEPMFIDFERCHPSKKPKNLTQFCQFLMSKQFLKYIKLNKKKLIPLLRKYKNDQTETNFKLILRNIISKL